MSISFLRSLLARVQPWDRLALAEPNKSTSMKRQLLSTQLQLTYLHMSCRLACRKLSLRRGSLNTYGCHSAFKVIQGGAERRSHWASL